MGIFETRRQKDFLVVRMGLMGVVCSKIDPVLGPMLASTYGVFLALLLSR
jgi:hypothetical protein